MILTMLTILTGEWHAMHKEDGEEEEVKGEMSMSMEREDALHISVFSVHPDMLFCEED